MRLGRRDVLKIAAAAAAAVALGARPVLALDREKNGYYLTGTGKRVKHVAFASADVYVISHYMSDLPARRSKELVRDMDVNKSFAVRVLRDIGQKDIRKSFQDALVRNGCTDQAKIDKFLNAFTHDLKKGAAVTITYAAPAKMTTLVVQGDGTAAVPGADFMKATWGIWFGNSEQPDLGDKLISRLP